MSERTIVVTGASGFLGGHVVAQLQADGWRVRAVTRRAQAVTADEIVVWHDASDESAIRRACAGADAIVHLAAHAHVFDAGATRAAEMARANIIGAGTVATVAAHAGVRRMLLVSSVGARGESNPANGYAWSKRASEDRVRECLAGSSTDLVVVRPPLVYGEGMKGRPLRLFQLVSRGLPVPTFGASNARSVAYVGNVAASIGYLVSPASPVPARAIYPADAEPMSTAALIGAIADALGVRTRIVRVPHSILLVAASIGTITGRRFVPVNLEDVRRALGTLVVDSSGAYPRDDAPFTTNEGLRRAARWFMAVR